MTFDLGADFGLYVAFRGTDGTLVGWKEDFNMAVRCPVPSQESAYRYADSILDRTERFLSAKKSPDIMIGGHSKGGNMAVYAAMQITQSDIEATNERVQRLGLLPALGGSVPGRNCRISRIFSHDGLECLKSWCIAAHIRQSRHESTNRAGILHYRHAVAIANQTNLRQSRRHKHSAAYGIKLASDAIRRIRAGKRADRRCATHRQNH